jgi:hypothetical protein
MTPSWTLPMSTSRTSQGRGDAGIRWRERGSMTAKRKKKRRILSREEFDAAMERRGFKKEIRNGVEGWAGIRLLTPEEMEAIERAKRGDTEGDA